MPNFYITFGDKYRHEEHPINEACHPDGYAVIKADNMTRAREVAFKHFKQYWAFIYDENEFSPALYPKGVIGTFE